jgi:hypothetical protein
MRRFSSTVLAEPLKLIFRGIWEWRLRRSHSWTWRLPPGGGTRMRNTLLLICVLGISFASVAQTKQSSWANLSGLQVGQKIQVVDITSKKHSGVFVSVSDSAISFKDAAGEKSVQRPDVRSVKLMNRHHRLRNALIGAGVGGGAGAAIGAAATSSHDFFGRGFAAAFLGVAGAVCGTTVGVLLPTHDTIYSTGSH